MSSNIRIQRICQHCGDEFTAKTTVTKYCGDTCAKRAYKVRIRTEKVLASNSQTTQTRIHPIEVLKVKPFLSITETGKLLGVSRRTLYRMIERNELNTGKAGRRTIVRREDLEKLFDQSQPILPKQEGKPKPLEDTTEYYNLTEVQNKYGISESTLQNLISRNNIPKMKMGWYSYVPKSIIDQLLT